MPPTSEHPRPIAPCPRALEEARTAGKAAGVFEPPTPEEMSQFQSMLDRVFRDGVTDDLLKNSTVGYGVCFQN